jgi:histidine triad (HIT) family protein
MTDCVFCRIISRQAPARIVYEDDRVLAFEDVNPQAPVHILVIPKDHIVSLDKTARGGEELLGRLLVLARDLARAKGIAASGYRIVLNTGRDSGQAVDHLHVHLIGGRRLGWPPG